MAFEYYRSIIGFSCAGNFAAIVQHWGIDTPGLAGPFSRAKAFVNACEVPSGGPPYLPALQTILSEDSFVSSVRCAKVSPGAGNGYAKVYADTVYPGTFSGNLDAAQVAGCVIWLSAADAGLNGRTFFPGVSEEALDLGRFTATYKSALSDVVAAILNGIQSSAGTFDPMIAHTNGTLFAEIAHGRLSLTAGTIRKRLKPV